jgi:peptidoglycan/xylan/chitin deacetylase (PgdA/CDA1 family)
VRETVKERGNALLKPMLKRALAGLLWRCRLIVLTGRLRRALRGPRLIVLCYHRVDADVSRPAFSALPGNFVRQMDWLGSRFQILGLSEVATYLSGELSLSGDAVALTFDDGYADNHYIVKPLLARRGMPATFFISSEPLLQRSAYWYDALWDGLGGPGPDPRDPEWGEDVPAEAVEAIGRYARDRDRASRQTALNACKGLARATRQRLLERFSPSGRAAAACETMTLEEARECSRAGIEIGGHTRSHPSLARVPADECEREIREGVEDLRREGFPVRAFAYPFGERKDTGGPEGLPRRVVAGILDMGLAFTTEERAVRPGDDPFLVPRKVITPQSLAQIALRLEILSWRR